MSLASGLLEARRALGANRLRTLLTLRDRRCSRRS